MVGSVPEIFPRNGIARSSVAVVWQQKHWHCEPWKACKPPVRAPVGNPGGFSYVDYVDRYIILYYHISLLLVYN